MHHDDYNDQARSRRTSGHRADAQELYQSARDWERGDPRLHRAHSQAGGRRGDLDDANRRAWQTQPLHPFEQTFREQAKRERGGWTSQEDAFDGMDSREWERQQSAAQRDEEDAFDSESWDRGTRSYLARDRGVHFQQPGFGARGRTLGTARQSYSGTGPGYRGVQGSPGMSRSYGGGSSVYGSAGRGLTDDEQFHLTGDHTAHDYRGMGPKNYTRSDERIREDLCERLCDAYDVDARDIDVTIRDGVATLTGTVSERGMKYRAEDLAHTCNGVRDVQNSLRVARPGQDAPAHSATQASQGNSLSSLASDPASAATSQSSVPARAN